MTSPGDSKKSLLWFWACWLALALTFALFAAASFLPDKRLWGVNHLAFYTPAVRFAVLVIAGFFLVSPLASATWRGILWVARPYFGGLENGYNVLALTGVASFVVFAAFRAATLLLGDGYFIINSFQHAASNGMGIAAYFDAVTAHERIYPATELLNFAASWAAARFGASPAGGVWILNCAVGAGVVVGILVAVRRLDWPDGVKLSVCALALFSGAIELFFGYVEHYTPAMAIGVWYALASVRTLSGEGRAWKPGLILLIGVLFHVQTLLLAPSYLWLLAWVLVCRRSPSRAGPTAVAVGVVTVAAAVAAGLTPATGDLLLPPLGTGGGYHLLSASHLADVMNEVLLLCPVWLLYAVLVIRARASRAESEMEAHGAGAFTWMLAVPAALFLFLFNPELGMARDWDLFCFTVFGLSAPGLLALIEFGLRPDPGDRTSAILAAAVALSAAMVFTWVGVNADTERSVARYRAILGYDKTNAGYAYEALARHFEDRFQYARQIDALTKAYESSRNPRYLLKLGQTYRQNHDPAGAIKYFRLYLQARPDDDDARIVFLEILVNQKRVDEMIAVSLAGIEHSPSVPEFHFYLGNAYLAKGMREEGLKAFAACSRLNPSPKLVQAMRRLVGQTGADQPDP